MKYGGVKEDNLVITPYKISKIMKKSTLSLCTFTIVMLLHSMLYADISLTIREKAGVTTENYPLTFGHVFHKGDITQGVIVNVDGELLPTQFDIKRRYQDNSVKHGVISVVLPVVRAGEDLVLTLVCQRQPEIAQKIAV